jgi:hypothetical protein
MDNTFKQEVETNDNIYDAVRKVIGKDGEFYLIDNGKIMKQDAVMKDVEKVITIIWTKKGGIIFPNFLSIRKSTTKNNENISYD